MADRINRVSYPLARGLHCRDAELRVVCHRQSNHLQTVSRRCCGLPCLVGRDRSGNKEHPVKPKSLTDLFGAPEMAPMNRIEGPAEEANSHWVLANSFLSPLKNPGFALSDLAITGKRVYVAAPGSSKRNASLSGILIHGSAHPQTQQISWSSVLPSPWDQRRGSCSY